MQSHLTYLASKRALEDLRSRKESFQKNFLLHLEINASDVEAILKLGLTLGPEECLKFSDGPSATKRDLYLKAVELNPSSSLAVHNLATTMWPREVIHLSNTRSLTQQALYLQAIALDPSSACSYNNLGELLSPEDQIDYEGKQLCAIDLFIKAIELDPKHAAALSNLGAALGWNGRLHGSEVESKSGGEMLFEAFRIDDQLSHVYSNIANLAWSEQQQSRQSARFDFSFLKRNNDGPATPMASCCSETSSATPKLLLPDSRWWSQADLYLKAIELEPSSPEPYRGLAGTLADRNEQVRLPDGSYQTRTELLARALSLERWKRKACDSLTKGRWDPNSGFNGGSRDWAPQMALELVPPRRPPRLPEVAQP